MISNALFFGFHDFRQRYRGARLGLLWGPLTTGVFIGFLGIIWSTLFKVELKTYLVFFTIGHLIWAYISGCIGEATAGLQQFESIVKNVRLNAWFYVIRIVSRNTLALSLNSVVLLVVMAVFPDAWVTSYLWMFIVGIFILSLTIIGLTAITLVTCTAYRDGGPLISSGMTMLMFATPVMWEPRLIRDSPYRWLVEFNPLHHILETVRTPVLGASPEIVSWVVAVCFSLAALGTAWLIFWVFEKRFSYWL
jgi:ABC-type polysaccharide/polyol phosphate export permease